MSTLGERLSVVATENAKLHIEIDKLAKNNADVKKLVETDDYKRTKLVTTDNALRGYN
tara:strand:- start:257 stop:430 length:174 start_codon:yes stop_codon:yes gene_type:complete